MLFVDSCFFSEAASFYAAQVACAFSFMHERCLVFRDLKPGALLPAVSTAGIGARCASLARTAENLCFAASGYLKVIDVGFAKQLPGPACKTFTVRRGSVAFCDAPR